MPIPFSSLFKAIKSPATPGSLFTINYSLPLFNRHRLRQILRLIRPPEHGHVADEQLQ